MAVTVVKNFFAIQCVKGCDINVLAEKSLKTGEKVIVLGIECGVLEIEERNDGFVNIFAAY